MVGKGWHLEPVRHSRARRFGSAGGKMPKKFKNSKLDKTIFGKYKNDRYVKVYLKNHQISEDAQKQAKAEEMQREGEIKVNKKVTPSDYEGFTGTQNYYKEWLGLRVTDGVKDLQERAEANWFVTDVASVLKANPKVKRQEFVTIKFKVKDNQGTATYEDGNGNKLYSQKYKYTDFPEGDWKFFYRDNILMFPSEY